MFSNSDHRRYCTKLEFGRGTCNKAVITRPLHATGVAEPLWQRTLYERQIISRRVRALVWLITVFPVTPTPVSDYCVIWPLGFSNTYKRVVGCFFTGRWPNPLALNNLFPPQFLTPQSASESYVKWWNFVNFPPKSKGYAWEVCEKPHPILLTQAPQCFQRPTLIFSLYQFPVFSFTPKTTFLCFGNSQTLPWFSQFSQSLHL